MIQKLADDFCNLYSNKSQIFISTHSPAFISLTGGNVSRYRVYRDGDKSNIAHIDDKKDKSSHLSELRSELGMLEIQSEVHELYAQKLHDLEILKTTVSKLEEDINTKSLPLVVTEGKTDSQILDAAHKSLKIPTNYLFRAADNKLTDGGSGGAGQLAKIIETIHPDDGRVVVAVFDNDEEGQREFNKLSKNFKDSNLGRNIKEHANGVAWATLLPEPEFRANYAENGNLCIEYMFEDAVLETKLSNGETLERKKPELKLILNGKVISTPKAQLLETDINLNSHLKISGNKDRFANEVVPTLKENDFRAFIPLFDLLNKILSN